MKDLMNNLRSRLILLLLCLYPVYGYFMTAHMEIVPDYLTGVLGYLLVMEVIFTKFRRRENLIFPHYLTALLVFAVYVFFSKVFMTNTFNEESIQEYLYRDPFLRGVAFIFVLENTRFSKEDIHLSLKFLFLLILVAAGVTLKQVSDPFFFRKEVLDTGIGLSYSRFQQLAENFTTQTTDELYFIEHGYRYSIYSWINDLSVGIDALAIFSIMLGLKSLGPIRHYTLMLAGGIVGILSSSRWIILNYLIISSQKIIGRRNPLLYAMKLGAIMVVTILILGLSASYIGVDINQFIQERLLSKSAGTRIYAFKIFGQVYFDAPIFGTGGVDTERMLQMLQGKTSQIHVGWLKLLYYYGLVGGILYVSFIILLLRHLYVLAKKSSYWGSFFAVLGFVFANFTLVELSIFYHGLFLALIFARYLYNGKPEIVPAKKVVLKPAITRPLAPIRRPTVEI